MPYRCPCPDRNESAILYKTNYKNKPSKFHVGITYSGGSGVGPLKPTLLKCKKCKLIFSEYTNVDFEGAYGHVVDETYLKQIESKTKTFKLFFSKIKQHLNQNSDVLEIGSYYGILGNIIKPHVKSYTGLESSRHAVEYSKKNFSLNAINQPLVKFLKNKFQFDVIIMADVIEHLNNPFEILDLIEKNLKPSGVLIVTTMNMDSLIPKILRSKYYWIVPQHTYYFSNSTLKYFLEKSNLNIFKIKTNTRLVSIEYLLNTLINLVPKFAFVFKFFLKFNFLKKLVIRINLLDLNIYFAKKIKN